MAIESKTIADLHPGLRQLFERAMGACGGGNASHAIPVLRDLLKKEPGCNDIRRVMHVARRNTPAAAGGCCRGMLGAVRAAWPIGVAGPRLVKQEKHAEALELAEDVLDRSPGSPSAYRFLSAAAAAAGLGAAAVEALESCLLFNPGHERTLRLLGKAYMDHDMPRKAVGVYQQLVSMFPNEGELKTGLSQATAAAAMDHSGWEGAGTFREVLRDEDRQHVLELEERMSPKDAGSLEALIDVATRAADESPDAGNLRKLGDLLGRAGRWDDALARYEDAQERSGSMDPGLDERITRAMLASKDAEIARWSELADGDPQRREASQRRVEELTRERDDLLLRRYEGRAEKYPGDTAYRFELGELYFDRGNLDGALREFQATVRNPNLRPKAMAFIGRCMAAKGLHDLAAEQFRGALALVPTRMTPDRKELCYELALACEVLGETAEAFRLLKEVYAADVTYRDVAARVEALRAREQGRPVAGA